MSSNKDRLASAVRAKRLRLGLNQEELSARGGPSDTTVSQIENGRLDTIARVTLRKLDAALEWVEGSANRIWVEGGEPLDLLASEAIGETVGRVEEDADTLLYRRPAGITDEKWRQLRARTRNLVEWEIEQALKESDGLR